MFCQKCGANIPEDTAFCPNCGTPSGTSPAVTAVQSPTAGGTMTAADLNRDDLLTLMNSSFEAMTRIKNQEDRIDNCDDKIERAGRFARIRWLVLFIFLGLFIGSALAGVNSLLGALVMIGGFAGGIAFIVMHKVKQKNLGNDRAGLVNELEGLKTDPAIGWLPYTYRDSESFAYIYRNIQNLRAHNLTEAINVYENDKHQARLEMISLVTAQSAADAASAASSAAGAAAASAFFSLFR